MKTTKEKNGITLIALVITIITLLILAGITINLIFNDSGILAKASETKEKSEIAKAREKLEIVLAAAQIEKHTNNKYNEQEFLNQYIIEKIKDSEIIEDIAIVDGFAFSLIRNVPRIGEYIGKEETLVYPELTVESNLAIDLESTTMTIKAKEEVNGISKIEIIQEGFVLKEYTYENKKEAITENYTVKQNGKYTIKVYSILKTIKEIEIDEIISSIKYTPNGNKTYEKQHSVKLMVEENKNQVKSIKYQWLQTTVEPNANTFRQTYNEGDTITGSGFTGTWYLWTLLETKAGKQRIQRSEAFYFDNEGPTLSFTSTPSTYTSFKLNVITQDNKSGLVKLEIYVDNVLKNTQTINTVTSQVTKDITIANVATGKHICKIVATDAKGNQSTKNGDGETRIYQWDTYTANSSTIYVRDPGYTTTTVTLRGYATVAKTVTFSSSSGFSYSNTNSMFDGGWRQYASWREYRYYSGGNKIYYQYESDGQWGSEYSIYNVKKYTCSTKEIWTKGESKNQIVTSVNSSQYPDNGNIGNIWYVKRK